MSAASTCLSDSVLLVSTPVLKPLKWLRLTFEVNVVGSTAKTDWIKPSATDAFETVFLITVDDSSANFPANRIPADVGSRSGPTIVLSIMVVNRPAVAIPVPTGPLIEFPSIRVSPDTQTTGFVWLGVQVPLLIWSILRL